MEKGLSFSEAEKKLQTFGKNEIKTKGRKTAISIFISQFPTVINGILTTAALLSFYLSDIIDGIFIFAVLIINGLFGFIQEYRAEKSLEKLKSFIVLLSRVIRNGKEIEIPTENLVPGDLVILCEGERIPADGILTLGRHIEIDESILTGESLPVIKNENDPLYKGTLVIKGRGQLLVQETGMATRFGEIAQNLSTIEVDKTPLQKQLNSLGKVLSLIIIFFSLLLIPIGLAQGKQVLPIILIAISIAIAAIPEGLPAVVTIALALGTNRMAKRQAIVRKMASIETLGAIQVILIDKTGTLTQNLMRVKKFFVKDKESMQDLFRACVLGNTASLVEKADGNSSFDVIGDKTDGALLLWTNEQSKDLEIIKTECKIIDEYAFDGHFRTITTVIEKNNKKHVFVRGAPEVILEKSKLEKKEIEKLHALFTEYAKEGLRVIGFGTKTVTNINVSREHLEEELNFLGFIGIYDPPRPEVKQAVIDAKNAGIRTIMVTGDSDLTALTIAKEVGLIEKDEDVITGDKLDTLSDEEVINLLPKIRVFARAKPEDKLRLATLFKQQGFIVGVTGDGVNDALALKKADVGIAMGESGTDVAKEASDIVLANDNFSTLVHAILEGRTIYNNIVKSITYLLSGNLSELSLVFFASILGMPNPLLPTQILWINIVTDVFPALALASDEKDPRVLKHSPRNPKTPILTFNRFLFIGLIGFSLSIFLLVIFKSLSSTNEVLARTIIFNLLIISHLFIAFIIRGKRQNINKNLLFITLITFSIQIIITTTPFFQKLFHLGY